MSKAAYELCPASSIEELMRMRRVNDVSEWSDGRSGIKV